MLKFAIIVALLLGISVFLLYMNVARGRVILINYIVALIPVILAMIFTSFNVNPQLKEAMWDVSMFGDWARQSYPIIIVSALIIPMGISAIAMAIHKIITLPKDD